MSFTEFAIREILSNFDLPGTFRAFEPTGCGHINDTLCVTFDTQDGEKRYILQRINTHVFTRPDLLMENVESVTQYLSKILRETGGDPARGTLTVFRTRNGELYHRTAENDCWRVYNYIEGTCTLQSIGNPDDFRKAGAAFGEFQQMLAAYPSRTLHETIPRFHDTASRFADFRAAVQADSAGRAADAQPEIGFVLARESDTHVLVDLLRAGKLPLRVTHNDTKLNNILFDAETKESLCVVDLDTVMPGLSLYDFGDSIRFGANTAAEDEPDTGKVSLSLPLYRAFCEGYLCAAGQSLTQTEIAYLPFSAKLMTLECGMRFLTDYLQGDTYFRTAYPEHNLVRCRTQLALVADMEAKMAQMQAITAQIARAVGKDVTPCC
ncbi:MAG: aminoglycoside phosphotransferase family protein [Clostridia bacterium]|nr:aminoglycoside phosphotransferase family protein [Clostridia bacterium]